MEVLTEVKSSEDEALKVETISSTVSTEEESNDSNMPPFEGLSYHEHVLPATCRGSGVSTGHC